MMLADGMGRCPIRRLVKGINTMITVEKEKISFRTDEVRKFFPKDYTTAQMQAVILKLLDEYQRKRQRDLAR